MDFNLFSLVKTKSDIDLMLGYVDALSDSLYRTGEFDYTHTVNTILPLDTAKMLVDLSPDKEIARNQLDGLRQTLHLARIIKLTLAFQPSRGIAENISASLRKIVNFDVVLDFAYDPSLLGGVIIEYQGKYVDRSIRKKLEALGL